MTEKKTRNISWQSEDQMTFQQDSTQSRITAQSPNIFDGEGESIMRIDDRSKEPFATTTQDTRNKLKDILFKINSSQESKTNIKKFKLKEVGKRVMSVTNKEKKKVKFKQSPINMRPKSPEHFDENQYYRDLLFKYGDELKQVFMGFDSTINHKTLARDIRKSKSNKHHYLIRNLRFIIKKNQFSHHNTDLDEYDDQFQSDKIAQLHKQLGMASQTNTDEKEKKNFLPDNFKHLRSNSILSYFKNEDAISRSSNNHKTEKSISDMSSKLSISKQMLQKQNQVEIIYFDKNLNMTKKLPIIQEKIVSDNSNQMMVRSSSDYTIKDITTKNANIKKIFSEICPEKFKKTKTSRYVSQQQSMLTKALYINSTADSTMIIKDQKPKNTSALIDHSKTIGQVDSAMNKYNLQDSVVMSLVTESNSEPRDEVNFNNVQTKEQSLKELYEKTAQLTSLPIIVKPKKPQVTTHDDALSILYKFQELHKYNIYNTRKKLENINIYKQEETQDVTYDDYYAKNKEVVVSQLDETQQKYQAKPYIRKKHSISSDEQPTQQQQRSQSYQTLPSYEKHLLTDYDESGRLIIKNHSLAQKLINNVLGQPSLEQAPASYIAKKRPQDAEPLSFLKSKKQIFATKTKPYNTMIQEKTSEDKLASYNQILRNLKVDSDLQAEQKVKIRDYELKEQEQLVQRQMQGQPLFKDLDFIDKVSESNKYFKWQMRKLEKNPLYKIDYKKELAVMDARIVRENAQRESQEMVELERMKTMEKRDMFMSRNHENRKKKKIIRQSLQQKRELLQL